ncbi:MAG: hypothetical protein Q4C65_14150 [Eubacteriales bacterium]|nr:hypothetical protein [Eubacteriales bacterium]
METIRKYETVTELNRSMLMEGTLLLAAYRRTDPVQTKGILRFPWHCR